MPPALDVSCCGDEVRSCFGEPIQHSHKMHVLNIQTVGVETVYLVRFLREAFHDAFFLKTAADFKSLMAKLHEHKEGLASEGSEASEIELLPVMPQTGRFGFRQAMARLSTPVADMAKQIEADMDLVLCQVKQFHKIPPLVEFFTESEDPAQRDAIVDAVVDLRAAVNLLTISGYWRLHGSQKIWVIFEDGTTHLDGRYRGAGFDLHEDTSRGLFYRTISRKDGWSIDLDRSNKSKLIWINLGQTADQPSELVWTRLTKEEAQPVIDETRKLKEDVAQARRDFEKSMIREAILYRVAAKRAGKPEMLNVPLFGASGNAEKPNDDTSDLSTDVSSEATIGSPVGKVVADDESVEGHVSKVEAVSSHATADTPVD